MTRARFIAVYLTKARNSLDEAGRCLAQGDLRLGEHKGLLRPPEVRMARTLMYPPSIDNLETTAVERDAAKAFVRMASELTPEAMITGVRRGVSGHLRMVLELPEGPIWELLGRLAKIASQVQQKTGISLTLD